MGNAVSGFLLLAVLLTPVAPVMAQDTDDDQFDESLRRAGWVSGMAMQCAEGTTRAGIERDALEAAAQIGRLFGTDRAFYYAAAFGYGGADALTQDKCEEFLGEHRSMMANLRKGIDPEQQP